MPLPTGRPLRAVTYYNLPNTNWQLRPGLHVVDFGLDLELDGEVWMVTWAGVGRGREWALNDERGTMAARLGPETETEDASTIAPWVGVLGKPVEVVERLNSCVIRLGFGAAGRVLLASGWHEAEADVTGIFGPNVLVPSDERLVQELAAFAERDCN
jgi:hypothetical protein